MEKKIKITTKDNYKIYGTLNHKIKVKKEFVVIKNAGHCFDEEGTEEKLFQETLNWFQKNV